MRFFKKLIKHSETNWIKRFQRSGSFEENIDVSRASVVEGVKICISWSSQKLGLSETRTRGISWKDQALKAC